MEKLQNMSFVELHNIYNFLNGQLESASGKEKEIIEKRMKAVKDELWRILNNVF